MHRDQYHKNKEVKAKKHKEWVEKNRERRNEINRRYQNKRYNESKEFRQKLAERRKTNYFKGKAVVCKNCGSSENVEHHPIRPYRWDVYVDLCRKCHKEVEFGTLSLK